MHSNRDRQAGFPEGRKETPPVALPSEAFSFYPVFGALADWQWQLYQSAYAQARAVVRPLPPVLAGRVSGN